MQKNKFPHKLVVITGPPAVGKDTVASELTKWLPLRKVITTTTRKPRPGEKRGRDYHFVSRERFADMIKDNLLIEHIQYAGNYYGTQRKDMRRPALENEVPLLVVDPQEALEIQRTHPEAMVIFLKPVSLNVIKKRLTARGGSLDEISERLQLAKEALHEEPVFAYSVINKDGELEDTIRATKKIIRGYLGL